MIMATKHELSHQIIIFMWADRDRMYFKIIMDKTIKTAF